jgi:hypothetical protein
MLGVIFDHRARRHHEWAYTHTHALISAFKWHGANRTVGSSVTAAVSLTGTPRDLQDSRRFGVTLSHSKRRLGILVEKKKQNEHKGNDGGKECPDGYLRQDMRPLLRVLQKEGEEEEEDGYHLGVSTLTNTSPKGPSLVHAHGPRTASQNRFARSPSSHGNVRESSHWIDRDVR